MPRMTAQHQRQTGTDTKIVSKWSKMKKNCKILQWEKRQNRWRNTPDECWCSALLPGLKDNSLVWTQQLSGIHLLKKTCVQTQ